MSVFALVDYSGQVLSVFANRANAELRMAELVEADKQHWLDLFGDFEDSNFDNYSIDEWEVN